MAAAVGQRKVPFSTQSAHPGRCGSMWPFSKADIIREWPLDAHGWKCDDLLSGSNQENQTITPRYHSSMAGYAKADVVRPLPG
jgi:hypothetical protein